MLKETILVATLIVLLSGCITAAAHQESLPSSEERKITVGTVQKEIKQGMTQTEVAGVDCAPLTGDFLARIEGSLIGSFSWLHRHLVLLRG